MSETETNELSTHAAGQFAILARFEVSVRSGTNAARRALEKVMVGLEPLALDLEELNVVELVLAEALNNIVEHAYPEGGLHSPIYIECSHLHDGLHFTIRDNGKPMPDGQTPFGKCPDLDVETDDLPEGGFGWFLIQDLAKDVEYQRDIGGNQLSLRVGVAFRPTSH